MAGIVTPMATLSFPQLFTMKPRARGAEPVYSCSLLFSPEVQKTPEYKALKEACKEVFVEKFGEKAFSKGIESPFRDAAEKEYTAYDEGWVYISPWTKNKPGIVDRNRHDVVAPEDVYAGQIVRAYVNPFAWENSGRKGVSFGLNGIQILVKDAPRIDGRASLDKVFDDGAELPEASDDGDDDSPF
jgi:hypothetical protein